MRARFSLDEPGVAQHRLQGGFARTASVPIRGASMKRRIALLVGGAACVGMPFFGTLSATAATNGPVTVTTEHYDDVTGAPCLGEPIHLREDITYRVRTVTSTSGNLLTAGHSIGHATAVGLDSGRTFTGLDSRQSTTNFLQGGVGHFIAAGAWTYMLIGQGAGPNLVITNQAHVTVTPSGEVSVEFLKIDVRCVG